MDWLVRYTGYSREHSIGMGEELADRRVFMHVVDRKKKLKDGKFFYRFQVCRVVCHTHRRECLCELALTAHCGPGQTVYAEDEDAFEEAMKEVEDRGRKLRVELSSGRSTRNSKDIWPLVSFYVSRSTEESLEGMPAPSSHDP